MSVAVPGSPPPVSVVSRGCEALDVMIKSAVLTPVLVGANTRLIVHWFVGVMVWQFSELILNSLAFVPVISIVLIIRSKLPVLLRVNACAGDWLPASMMPKA